MNQPPNNGPYGNHYPPQPGQFVPPPPPQKKRAWIARHPIWTGIITLLLFSCVANIVVNAGKSGTTTSSTSGNTAQVTPTPKSANYPPKTQGDLQGLAVKGDVNAVHGFDSESVGLTGACPQPKRGITINPAITGQQLAEDLLAYFYAQQMDSPCGSLLLAYHSQAEANDPNGGAYTAGRILVDVTDSSGATNVDPNASGLKYKITLDVGGLGEGQEYIITY